MHFQTERAQQSPPNNGWDPCLMKFQKIRTKRKTDRLRERTHRDRESEWPSASHSTTANQMATEQGLHNSEGKVFPTGRSEGRIKVFSDILGQKYLLSMY